LEKKRAELGWTEQLSAAATMLTGDFIRNPLDACGSLVDEAIRRAEETPRPHVASVLWHPTAVSRAGPEGLP
jgi:hypothetical protein